MSIFHDRILCITVGNILKCNHLWVFTIVLAIVNNVWKSLGINCSASTPISNLPSVKVTDLSLPRESVTPDSMSV